MLYGCSAGAIGRLQRVQNYAARCDTVKPVHAITAVATVVTPAASATAACLQSSAYHIQSHNHVNSISCYDQTLRQILDKHAPLVTKRVSLRKSAAWYDSECRVMEHTTRRLERQYRSQRSAGSLSA